MSHGIEIETKHGSTVAPEFVYVNLRTPESLEAYSDYLNTELGLVQ